MMRDLLHYSLNKMLEAKVFLLTNHMKGRGPMAILIVLMIRLGISFAVIACNLLQTGK